MELHLASYAKRYSTDDVATFRGVFRLSNDQFGLNYLLEDAVGGLGERTSTKRD